MSCACLVYAGSASAQDDATRMVAARASFSEGVAHAEHGQWVEAIQHFRRALALHDSTIIAFNLGVALSHEGHPVEASELFQRVVRDDSSDRALRSDAGAALEAAQPAMAWALVSYARPTVGLTLAVDGAPASMALLGTTLPLDPGAHHFIVARGEVVVGGGSLSVHAGEHARLELTLLDDPGPPSATPSRVALDPARVVDPLMLAPPADDPTGLYIGLGVGGGLVIATAVVVLAIVLVPTPDAAPYSGSLGIVEIGR